MDQKKLVKVTNYCDFKKKKLKILWTGGSTSLPRKP